MLILMSLLLLAEDPASKPQGFIDENDASVEAQPEAAEEEDEEEPSNTKVVVERPWYQALELGGFLDAGFGVWWPSQANAFFVGEVELDLKKNLFDVAALRVDLNLLNRLPWQPGGALLGTNFANPGVAFDNLLEQGYAEWFPLGEEGPRLRLGKYNANVAIERLDPTERFTVSQSLVFLHGAPGNFTGLMLDIPLPASFELTFHIAVNGWDRGLPSSRNKTAGAKLGYDHTFKSDIRLHAAVTGVFGTERFANESDYRLSLFGSLLLDVAQRFYFAAESTWGQEPGLATGTLPGGMPLGGLEAPPGAGTPGAAGAVGTARWFGVSGWARIVVPRVDWLSFTLRYDFFDDPKRTRGLVQTQDDLLAGGLSRRQQATLAVAARVVEGARVRVEYSADFLEGKEPDKVRALAVAHRLVLQALWQF